MSTSKTSLAMARADQKFLVATPSEDRRWDDPQDPPARVLEEFPDPGDGLLPLCLGAHDTALTNRLSARFELRFDEANQPGARRGKAQRGRKRQGQADEAHIGDDGAGRLLDVLRIEAPRVGPLEHHDPGVGAELGVELVSS